MNIKKSAILIVVCILAAFQVKADEGMWLLTTLGQINQQDMQSKGLKLSADDIYSTENSSLKDAIVIFGNGCTGEIVSSEGLLFTNHHCGYGSIQSLSSVENDYLKYGFWAMNRAEEIHAPGLSVRFIRHIEDVTNLIAAGLGSDLTQSEREAAVAERIRMATERYAAEERFQGMSISIRDFFGGNQYIMFAIETYNDVRLVGTPPSSIGKFGGDTDNWMWPRHTGDFSVFRVYADANGRPAEYSKDNVPYKAPVHLKVSLAGYEQGDFAMIMGFPGSTNRYMTSYEIDQTLKVDNPNRIKIRGVRQAILSERMKASDEIRIKYASKYAGSSNYWKNSIGMSRGLEKLRVKEQKEAEQKRFTRWVEANQPSRSRYTRALPLIRDAVAGRTPYAHVNQYVTETLNRGVELTTAASLGLILADQRPVENKMEKIVEAAQEFYKDYDEPTDRTVAMAMFALLGSDIPQEDLPSVYQQIRDDFGGNYAAYVDYLYDNSVFTCFDKFKAYLDAGDYSQVAEDPGMVLLNSIRTLTRDNRQKMAQYESMFREGHRLYIEGLMDMDREKMFYPDANFTIRLTYGNILPYSPADAVVYNYYTTLSGVIAKEDPSNPTEFTVPDKLKELYYSKDFGQYAYNGDVPVGFLSNNDITGGNSGSPVLNDKGELIGLAFDGNWEAMSGDIAFEPELQRCINVDIRYVLFIIDKFAGAKHLIDELTIVN